MLAKLIVIEGPDKSGKATQAKLLFDSLGRYGANVTLVEIPYNDGMTHKIIYKMLNTGLAKSHPNIFQFFQFANKFIFQLSKLSFCMLTCDYVILDRWSPSMITYGSASGANDLLSKFLYSFLIKPNVTLVMSGKTYTRNTVDDSYESDVSLQDHVNDGYKSWCETNKSNNAILIDNSLSTQEVHENILKVINNI